MGWGTFIAGQTISAVRRAGRRGRTRQRPMTAAERRELLQREANEIQSTVRTIIRKTPLIHPDLAAKVDMNYWYEEMGRRLTRSRNISQALVLTPLIAGYFYGFFKFWPDPIGPETNMWAFLAVAALVGLVLGGFGMLASETLAQNRVANSVRKAFWAEGYNVAQLMSEGARLSQADEEAYAARARHTAEQEKARLRRERFGK